VRENVSKSIAYIVISYLLLLPIGLLTVTFGNLWQFWFDSI